MRLQDEVDDPDSRRDLEHRPHSQSRSRRNRKIVRFRAASPFLMRRRRWSKRGRPRICAFAHLQEIGAPLKRASISTTTSVGTSAALRRRSPPGRRQSKKSDVKTASSLIMRRPTAVRRGTACRAPLAIVGHERALQTRKQGCTMSARQCSERKPRSTWASRRRGSRETQVPGNVPARTPRTRHPPKTYPRDTHTSA